MKMLKHLVVIATVLTGYLSMADVAKAVDCVAPIAVPGTIIFDSVTNRYKGCLNAGVWVEFSHHSSPSPVPAACDVADHHGMLKFDATNNRLTGCPIVGPAWQVIQAP